MIVFKLKLWNQNKHNFIGIKFNLYCRHEILNAVKAIIESSHRKYLLVIVLCTSRCHKCDS